MTRKSTIYFALLIPKKEAGHNQYHQCLITPPPEGENSLRRCTREFETENEDVREKLVYRVPPDVLKSAHGENADRKGAEDFGRIRLSKPFFKRDFLNSEIANINGQTNLPTNVDLAVKAGSKLCSELLEPLQDTV